MDKLFSLQGKVALVTGGAHGIGGAIAKAYGLAGAKVAFNGREQEKVDKAAKEYKAQGIYAKGYVCDVNDETQVEQMVRQIENDLGIVDILVNNAGIIKRIPMTDMSVQDFKAVIDTDLTAPFIVAKAVIPNMIKKGHGKIINVCSMMSELGRETVSAYAAAKGGLKMLTKNIASEYGHLNIQCNGLGPGYIATPQTAPLRTTLPNGDKHPFDQFIIAKTPAARWGTTDDLTGPAIFLAADASNFVNGHILYVDGGILAYIGKQP
jgi:gluconate 5-dehydrogenase